MRVSTIIPAYNAAPFIEESVASALAQAGVDMEVIVVDDGSTDATWHKLEGFGDRIRKVRQVNGGPGKARNHGARLATGEWLAFVDADDAWLPEKTVKQVAACGNDIDLCYAERVNIGETRRVGTRQSDFQSLWDGDIFEALLVNNFITVSSVMVRKSRFEQLGGFAEDLIGVEDWDFLLRHAATHRVAVCREVLVRYRVHAASMSNDLRQMNRTRLRVLRRALALPRGQGIEPRVARQAFASAWECSAWSAAATRRWQAFRWYLRSACYTPFNLRLYKEMLKCCLGRA